MRKIISGLIVFVIGTMILTQMAACASTTPEETTLATTPISPIIPPAQTATNNPAETAITLEEAEKELQEQGYTVADTVEKASLLAGYQVATPSFIPEGFLPQVLSNNGSFNIHYLDPNRTPRDASEYPIVTQIFRPDGVLSNNPFFDLTQSKSRIGAAGYPQEDIKIGNNPGKKVVVTGEGTRPDTVALYWGDGNLYYSLIGALESPLDQDTMLKLAASVGVH